VRTVRTVHSLLASYATKLDLTLYLSRLKRDNRAPSVKKFNRALLVLGVFTATSLAPLSTFASTATPETAENFSKETLELIVDNQVTTASTEVASFMNAAVIAKPRTEVQAKTPVAETPTKLVMADTAVVSTNPVETKQAPEPEPITPVVEEVEFVPPVTLAADTTINTASANYDANLAPPENKLDETVGNNGPRKALPAQKVRPPGPRYHGERFGAGYCTQYVADNFDNGYGIAWYDNAGAWLSRAQQAGWSTGSTPAAGAIMVSNESGWGHVALVESVDFNNRTFRVSEQNFVGLFVISERTISFDSGVIQGFIY